MTFPADVIEGEAYVFGQSSELARKLLQAATAAGYPTSVVRSGDDGFYVPVEVAEIVYPPTKEG